MRLFQGVINVSRQLSLFFLKKIRGVQHITAYVGNDQNS